MVVRERLSAQLETLSRITRQEVSKGIEFPCNLEQFRLAAGVSNDALHTANADLKPAIGAVIDRLLSYLPPTKRTSASELDRLRMEVKDLARHRDQLAGSYTMASHAARQAKDETAALRLQVADLTGDRQKLIAETDQLREQNLKLRSDVARLIDGGPDSHLVVIR